MLCSNLLFRLFLTLLIAHRSVVNTEMTATSKRPIMRKAINTTKPVPVTTATTIANIKISKGFTTKSPILSRVNNTTSTKTLKKPSNSTKILNVTPSTPPLGNITVPDAIVPTNVYCTPSLCELYNGTHVLHVPHIGCNNSGAFGHACGAKPHLLYMNQRRRQFILDMHNLARERIASGQLEGYRSAAHMPMLKWDDELAYLATLHVKRCHFGHDQCRNTPRYEFSGQNIGYFWIGREFKSHARRIKSFILNWFKEYRDANQTFIDKYTPHPEGKKIGHFTMLVSDRAHRVGCAAIRYRDPKQIDDMKLLMTCNYDFTNVLGEPIYQKGPSASKCIYRISEKYPSLCDWKNAVYDYDSEESIEGKNDNAIDSTFIN